MAKTPKRSHSETRVMESILSKSTKDGKISIESSERDYLRMRRHGSLKKLSLIKKYEESISKGIPFSETKDYNVDEEKIKKDKPIAVDEYRFNKYGLKTLEKAKTATTPILGFVLSANQRPRSTGQIRVLKTVNSHTRQSTCIRKRKHNESINCHLDRLMKSAKKGRRYSEANIPGVLRAQYNLMREKYYLVQLISKNVVPIHPDNIPLKFKDECSRIDGDALFGF